MASHLAATSGEVVYVSGEETLHQIRLRAKRLGISGERLYLLAETNLDSIIEHLDRLKPCLAIVDSIQSVFLPELDTSSGSITQVRECTLRLMRWAKQTQTPVFITGHVTKDGAIAGPRVLEHIVDSVLYFEGEPFSSYRLLRAVKNRFGSTNEVGIFEMKEKGLAEVDNPSQLFLSQRQGDSIGSVVTATLEGSRPLLVVVQALTSLTSFGLPRRTANGVDFGRLLLITAVLTPQARPETEQPGHHRQRHRRHPDRRAGRRPGHRPRHRLQLQRPAGGCRDGGGGRGGAVGRDTGRAAARKTPGRGRPPGLQEMPGAAFRHEERPRDGHRARARQHPARGGEAGAGGGKSVILLSLLTGEDTGEGERSRLELRVPVRC